ncbi:unnamed protein product, partial [Ceratitis capitata]
YLTGYNNCAQQEHTNGARMVSDTAAQDTFSGKLSLLQSVWSTRLFRMYCGATAAKQFGAIVVATVGFVDQIFRAVIVAIVVGRGVNVWKRSTACKKE